MVFGIVTVSAFQMLPSLFSRNCSDWTIFCGQQQATRYGDFHYDKNYRFGLGSFPPGSFRLLFLGGSIRPDFEGPSDTSVCPSFERSQGFRSYIIECGLIWPNYVGCF